MPSANKITTPVAVDLPEIQGRYADLDGYTVGFESYPEDVDPAPFFRGLPDDRCQCQHWGVVQSGQITFRWADHEETYGAGDAYYAGPGHCRSSRPAPAWWSSARATACSRRCPWSRPT